MALFKRDTTLPLFHDLCLLLLRLMVGGMMLPYGVAKFTGEFAVVQGMLAAQGLPEFLAYGVYVGELAAPLLILTGWYTRPAAAVLAFNMLVAVGLAHAGEVLSLNEHGGWAIDLQAFFLFGAVAIALLGAGRLSVSQGEGRWD